MSFKDISNYKLTDNDIFDYIEKTITYTQTTKNIYLHRLSIIKGEFFGGHKTLSWVLEHPKEFEEALVAYGKKHNLKSSSMAQYVAIMISIITRNPLIQEVIPNVLSDWKDIKSRINQKTEEHYLSNQPNEKQKKAFIPYHELLKIKDSLPIGSTARLLISLYCYIPPNRNNYWAMKIVKSEPTDTKFNYLVMIKNKDPYILLNHFKTSKIYRQIRLEVPHELEQEIKGSLSLTPREYLFVGRNGQPYRNSHSFDEYANRQLKLALKKPDFNLTMFRHIYISRPDLNLDRKTLRQKTQLAEQMGHTVSTQQKYQWKEDLEENDENIGLVYI